tara:strand:+ start:89 stop:463 length:375 start_codon:yes stop_codon:yes gene_type:complete
VASRRKENQENVKFRVIRLLNENPEISTRQIAKKVGISNGAAFYIINALIDKGFVKLENFLSNPRKGQYAYLLTPKGIREKSLLTYYFLERKRQEFEELRTEIKTLEEEVGLNTEPITTPDEKP